MKAALPSPESETRVDGAFCSTLALKRSQHKRRGSIPGQMSAKVAGTVQTWNRDPAAPLWAAGVIWRNTSRPSQKKSKELFMKHVR